MEIVKGNFLTALKTGEVDAIAHGVNCQGKFGSGIAKQIKEQYPNTRALYMRRHREFGWELGEIQLSSDYIFNCATQEDCGYNGKRFVNYEAIYSVMENLKNACNCGNITKLGLPKIGCGLAGGNWNIIKTIIEEVFKDSQIEVTVYEYNG